MFVSRWMADEGFIKHCSGPPTNYSDNVLDVPLLRKHSGKDGQGKTQIFHPLSTALVSNLFGNDRLDGHLSWPHKVNLSLTEVPRRKTPTKPSTYSEDWPRKVSDPGRSRTYLFKSRSVVRIWTRLLRKGLRLQSDVEFPVPDRGI